MTVKRIWALTGELKVEINGIVTNVNVTLFPANNGFIAIIQFPMAWKSYYIDTINDLPIAIKQAIVDIRRLNGNNDLNVNIRIIESKIGNTYKGYLNMVRDKVISPLDPLNDIYTEI